MSNKDFDEKGWKIPDLDEANRRQRLATYSPESRWSKLEGVVFRERADANQPGLVSIQGIDHKGERVQFWTDLPNAMYLMNMLAAVQQQARADVPSDHPQECQPYDGSP